MGDPLQTPLQIPDDQNPEIFTCEICIEPTEKKFRNGDNGCSHPFCTDCVVKYIRVKLEDNVGRIKCPSLTCDRTLSPRVCESLVGPSLFVRWCDVLCEEAIVGLDRCYCPYVNCSALIVNECSGTAKKSNCPDCKKLFCFKCKRVWHAGGCEENRDRNDVDFKRLAKTKKWKRCPGCSYFVELNQGCSIVQCRCGISFCYKCGNQVNNHQHWCCSDDCCIMFRVVFAVSFYLIFIGVLFFIVVASVIAVVRILWHK